MDNISIAIITEDIEYGETLGACLGYYRRDFIVSLFQAKDLHDFSFSDYDIILLDGQTNDSKVKDIHTIIQLCEKKSASVIDLEKGSRKIWRYEKVDNMISDIIYILNNNNILNSSNEKIISASRAQNIQVMGFISSCGGAGCSSITWAFLQELRRFYKKKVLYISLEEIESSSEFIKPNDFRRYSDEFIYKVVGSKKTDGISVCMDSFLCSDEYGVKALIPFRGRNMLKTLNTEDLAQFLDVLKKSCEFDVIAIDFGCGMSMPVTDNYKICDKLCFITDATRKKSKDRKMLDYFEIMYGTEFINEMLLIVNKCDPGESSIVNEFGPGRISSENIIMISYDETSFIKNEVTRIVPDKNFGMAIRKLVKKLMN